MALLKSMALIKSGHAYAGNNISGLDLVGGYFLMAAEIVAAREAVPEL